MPHKLRLMTPGPTPVPPTVLAAMSQEVLHHRGADYTRILARVIQRLREVFRSGNDVLLFAASGSGAMESAVANLCSPGDPVLVVSAGYFGERWAQIAERYGCRVDQLRYAWGETPSPEEIGERVEETGAPRAVFVTHSETSTGVVVDLQAIAARLRGSGAVLVVDAVSSLGALPLEADAWGIDVVVSGSQKALMTPPGLALASVSEGAYGLAREATSPRFYFDWERTRAAQTKLPPANPFTPAVSLVVALDAALDVVLGDGLETAFDRHVRLGRACRAGAKAMGLELFSPDEDRSAVVTAMRVPPAIDSAAIVRAMRDGSGVTIVGGQGELRGKIVRVGHIGYVDVYDICTALASLELSLVEAGADVERGVAVSAALDAYGETARV